MAGTLSVGAALSLGRGVRADSLSLTIVGPGPLLEDFSVDPAALAQSPADGIGPLLASALYEGLTSLGSDGSLRPALARSWMSADNVEWIFMLVDGVPADPLVRYLNALSRVNGPLAGSSQGKITKTPCKSTYSVI